MAFYNKHFKLLQYYTAVTENYIKNHKNRLTNKNICGIINKRFEKPMWWNWQTRGTQNPVVAIPCGFDPHHRHQSRQVFWACRNFFVKNHGYALQTAAPLPQKARLFAVFWLFARHATPPFSQKA